MEKKVAGIKETKELLKGCMVLTGLLLERLKDGFQMEDLPVLLSKIGYDPELRAAVQDLGEIPGEFRDLDVAEGMELVMLVLSEVPEMLKKLSK